MPSCLGGALYINEEGYAPVVVDAASVVDVSLDRYREVELNVKKFTLYKDLNMWEDGYQLLWRAGEEKPLEGYETLTVQLSPQRGDAVAVELSGNDTETILLAPGVYAVNLYLRVGKEYTIPPREEHGEPVDAVTLDDPHLGGMNQYVYNITLDQIKRGDLTLIVIAPDFQSILPRHRNIRDLEIFGNTNLPKYDQYNRPRFT